MSKLIDLTNQTIGYWKVLKRGENTKQGQAKWICECQNCGTIKEVSGGHLRSGRSTNCGCIRKEKLRQSTIKDETGKIYGYLKVERQASKLEYPRVDRTGIYWVCTCLRCGRQNVIIFGDYLRNGDTKSCGCLLSKNESLIADLLTQNSIPFIQQKTFKDLTTTGRSCDSLRFDFNIQNKYLLEYDGIQHFKKKHCFNEESFITTHKNDLLKNQYCFKNDIPIIRIPYDVEWTYKDLFLETTRFLLTPENEDEYYSLRMEEK